METLNEKVLRVIDKYENMAFSRPSEFASEIASLIEKDFVEVRELIKELFKLFDENILIRNTDYDDDFLRFTKEGTRITNIMIKLQEFVDKKK